MLIFEPGTKVDLEDGIKGTILSVMITHAEVKYEVVWWSGRDRKIEWLYDFEIKIFDNVKNLKIGFK